jgi:general secretion pathway protein A
MYAHFYHLSENPFNLTPDPKFHYINESTREALAAVLYGIKSRKGFLTLIGEAGTGKTTLLRRIVDEIEGETRIVFVFNPGVSFDELLEYLCMELGIRTDPAGRLQLIERLNHFLLAQLTEGRNVVVIIDEAQTLEDDVLEELRLLSNLETSKEKILQIVLSGQPELEDKLRRPNLRQLRQRIGVRATLKPMRSDEIRAYVETRLRSAGSQKAELFTASALHRCWQASQGIPRVINVICDNAMMIAFAEGSDRITTTVMNAAIRDLDGLNPTESWLGRARSMIALPAVRYGVAATAVVAAAFLLGRGLTMSGDEGAPVRVASQQAPPAPNASSPPSAPAPARPQVTAPATPPAPAAPAPAAHETPVQTAVAPSPPLPPSAAPAPAAMQAPAVPAPSSWPPADQATDPAPAGMPPAVGAPAEGSREPIREAAAPTPPANSAAATAGQASGAAGHLDLSTDSIKRRAEEMARSTAAKLYGSAPAAPGDAESDETAAVTPSPRRPVAEKQAGRGGSHVDAYQPYERDDERPRADAEAMAAEAMRHPEAAVQSPPSPRLAASAPPSMAAPPSGLAAGLESLASISGSAGKPAKSGDIPVVGRRVHVARGDTVWAIAMQYYGSVDQSVLAEIFRHNPGIRNAHQLPVGTEVFVPFLKPEHMIDPVQGGGYRVLVAESAEPAEIAKASSWAASRLPGRPLQTLSKGKDNPVHMVYATGFSGREAALAAARQLLPATP